MFIKNINRLLFLSLFITGLNGNSVVIKENNNSNATKSIILDKLIGDTKTQSPWKIISDIKSDFVDQKIKDAENLDLYAEITNALNHAVKLKQFLMLFIPCLTKELKSEKFNNNTMSKIDEALNNNELNFEDIVILTNLSKNKVIGKKLGYAISNIVLSWIYDIILHVLESKSETNPELKTKNDKYIKILNIIKEKTEEQINLLVPKLPEKSANTKEVELLLKIMNFDKMVIEPAAKKIIELNIKQKNLAAKLVFKGFLKGKKESELTQHMMDITIQNFQKTFSSLEIKELIKIFNSNFFKKLITVKNKQSDKVALMHIINSYATEAQKFYEAKIVN